MSGRSIAEHRDIFKIVLEEMIYYSNFIDCDNDYCEMRISKVDAVTKYILGDEYYFCNSDCGSYGEWSIRYDYRKSLRRLHNYIQ